MIINSYYVSLFNEFGKKKVYIYMALGYFYYIFLCFIRSKEHRHDQKLWEKNGLAQSDFALD